MWILPTWCFSIKRPQNPPVFRWKGKRNSRVYNAGRRGRKFERGAANRLQTAGVPKAGEGRAEKPTTTTFLGSTTRTPHSGPFFLPPQSHLASILVLLYSSPTSGRQASERWWRSGRNRSLLRLPARSRRASERARGHGCSLLQALRLLVASPLQITDARYAPTAHCHHRCLSLGFSVFLFSLSSSHSRRAPRPAPDSSVVGGGGVGPAFGVFFLLRLFRGFCCSFPRA